MFNVQLSNYQASHLGRDNLVPRVAPQPWAGDAQPRWGSVSMARGRYPWGLIFIIRASVPH